VAPVGADSTEALRSADRQLGEYFAGSRRHFDLELAPVGTPFQRSVWFALADIPYAGTISYAELAARSAGPAPFVQWARPTGPTRSPSCCPVTGDRLRRRPRRLQRRPGRERQLLDLERSVFAGRAPARLAV